MSTPPTSLPADFTGGAVFVSYAREDTAASNRICDALRLAGNEVWFDQNELGGGDAWDRKIRAQISACALFVPVVSAATQARREGYFRLEWKLADERTHLMAEGTPFILPVVIDDTKEREALVPKSFLAVQWTRLPGGEAGAAFGARAKKLLAPDVGASLDDARAARTRDGRGRATPLQNRAAPVGRRVPAAAWAGAFAVLAIGAGATFFATRKSEPAPAAIPNAGAGTRPPAISAKSIAVLPFTNMSDDKDANAFFADGIHEDILTNLANIAELKVISRTSVMQYRDTKVPLRKIAQDLGVAYVLEGSVRRAGAQVRVTGQLIRAATDEHVWAKNYDQELTANKLFAIQTALATEIADALRSVLSPQEKNLIARVPTASLDAYDLYLKARDLRNRQGTSPPTVTEQEQLLARAVAIDPHFGLAWAQLAWARSNLSSGISVANDARAARAAGAREAVAKAKGIIPDSPEFFLGRGWFLYFVEEDYGRAFEEFQKATELSPSFAEARYALTMVHRRQGHWRETLQALHEVERIDPANPEYAQEIAVTALSGRRYAEAEVALRRAMALGRTAGAIPRLRVLLPLMSRGELPSDELWDELPTGPLKREIDLLREKPATTTGTDELFAEAFKLAAKGEKDAVRAQLEQPARNLRRRMQSEPTNASLWSQLGVMEALSGNREEALRCVGKATGLNPESKDAWVGQNYRINVAHVRAWTGDAESALREYERLLQTMVFRAGAARSDSGFWVTNVHVMRRHPAFAPLRDDPRFQKMLDDPKNNAPLF